MWIQDQEPNAQGTQKQKQKQTKNKIQFSSAVYGGGRGHNEKSWLLSTLQTSICSADYLTSPLSVLLLVTDDVIKCSKLQVEQRA